MSTIKDIKVEGQSFDIAFITVHKDSDSFVAQCEKQNLWPKMDPAKRETMMRELYAYVKGQPRPEVVAEVVKKPFDSSGIRNSKLKEELTKRGIDFEGTLGFDALRQLLHDYEDKKQGE